MKLSKNNHVCDDLIIMTILGAIVGAIFITVIFTWQEIKKIEFNKELHKTLNNITYQDKSSNELSYQDPKNILNSGYIEPYNDSAEIRNYRISYSDHVFYHVNKDEKIKVIETPFELENYNYINTIYGFVFYEKGPIKSYPWKTTEGDFDFESGIQPEIYIFKYENETWQKLPDISLEIKDDNFEMIYAIYDSINEEKLIFEIGKYKPTSKEFEPGLVGPQPISSRSIIYDIKNNRYIENNIIGEFLKILNKTNTLFISIYWDSINNIIVGLPGGEGCGAYDVIYHFDVNNKIMNTVGGENSFDFNTKKVCNPGNSISPDGKWFILRGLNLENNFSIYLFNYNSLPDPIKEMKNIELENEKIPTIKGWNLTNQYPIVTFNNGLIVDFNK